jgi:transposase
MLGMSSSPITGEELASLPPEFRRLLERVIAHYEGLLAKQAARIAELETQLGKTPQNSSLPPSSQHPHAKPPQKQNKNQSRSKKRRGGQPGHAKHERPLIPRDECDEVQDLRPSTCRRCGEKLRGRDPAPLRHQAWELPEIRPHVTEYRRHRLTCRRCGESTCAQLPAGVPPGTAGPRLVALVALLMGCYRQSKRRTALFLEQILGRPCSAGWVVKLQNQACVAVRPAYDQLAAALPRQPTLGLDETPTKEGAAKAWLWTYVAERSTLFAVRGSREATGVSDLLGEQFAGVVTCDRARMYLSLANVQWCWAHLKRDFQKLVDSGDQRARRVGWDLGAATRRLFAHWRDFRAGAISRCALVRRMGPVRRRIELLLKRGAASGHKLYAGMCRELHTHRQRLWPFLKHEGVEPTNNASERALRHAVIWRKLSFGTQSAAGSRFVETMLTVVETCRQQKQPVFDFLVRALKAHAQGRKTPSLLPGA